MSQNQLLPKGLNYATDNFGDLVNSFLQGRTGTTLKAYSADLQALAQFLEVDGVNEAARSLLTLPPGQANALALKFKAHLIDLKLSPATVNRRLSALRSLVHFARVIGLIQWELEVENQQHQQYRDTKGVGTESVKKIFQHLEQKQDAKSIRDNAILHLLFDLGLRRQEVCNIDLEDLNLDDTTVAILSKGRIEKEKLSLPTPTVEALKKWLAVRGTHPGPLVFRLDKAADGSKRRLTGTGLYQAIKDLGAKVGLRGITVHGLRHSAITECCKVIAENGLGVETLVKFSRHKSLNTAMVYMDHLEDQQGKLAALVAKKVS